MFSIVWLSKYCIKMLSLFFCFIYTQWFNRIRLSFLSINILIYLLFQYSLEGFEILPFGFSPDSPLPLSSHKHTMKPQGVPIHRIETVVFLAEKKDQHVIVCSQIWLAYLSRRTTSAVHSARRYSVTQLLFPVDTVSAWSASRTSGTMKKRVIVSAAALNAKTPFSRGLSWSRTLFWLKWWKEWRSPSVEIMWVLEVSADLLKTVRRQGLRPVMLWVGPDPRRYPEPLVSEALKSRECPIHDRLLEIYCCDDDQCICPLCALVEHKAHKNLLAKEGRKRKQVLTFISNLALRVSQRLCVYFPVDPLVIQFK